MEPGGDRSNLNGDVMSKHFTTRTALQSAIDSAIAELVALRLHSAATPGMPVNEFGRATDSVHAAVLRDFIERLAKAVDPVFEQAASDGSLKWETTYRAPISGCNDVLDMMFELERRETDVL